MARQPACAAVWDADRARAAVIERDLVALGAEPEAADHPATDDWLAAVGGHPEPAAWLGVIYLFEGSRMGSMALLRPVARALGVPPAPGCGVDYHLDGAAGLMPRWQRFKAALDALPLTPGQQDAAACWRRWPRSRCCTTCTPPRPGWPPPFSPGTVIGYVQGLAPAARHHGPRPPGRAAAARAARQEAERRHVVRGQRHLLHLPCAGAGRHGRAVPDGGQGAADAGPGGRRRPDQPAGLSDARPRRRGGAGTAPRHVHRDGRRPARPARHPRPGEHPPPDPRARPHPAGQNHHPHPAGAVAVAGRRGAADEGRAGRPAGDRPANGGPHAVVRRHRPGRRPAARPAGARPARAAGGGHRGQPNRHQAGSPAGPAPAGPPAGGPAPPPARRPEAAARLDRPDQHLQPDGGGVGVAGGRERPVGRRPREPGQGGVAAAGRPGSPAAGWASAC